ncbi:MAG TPA: hypothetical protein ENJ66_01335 [Calditrichae bacterium]|nr:hypothetical protein [Calditrichia bacterium]
MMMNVLPVLKEITDALDQLLQGGSPHFIYTNKMPFSPEDIQLLSTLFQRGEVEITDNSTNNKSVVYNTRYPGVWVTTLWGRTLEFTPILEIVEINWYPQVVAFPPEDVAQGVRQFLTAVMEVAQIPTSIKEQLQRDLRAVSPEKEIRWPLEGEWESLLHYVLAPGAVTISSPTIRFTATRFWGVWLGHWAQGKQELVVTPFPETLRAHEGDVRMGLERLRQKYQELRLTLPVQGPSG